MQRKISCGKNSKYKGPKAGVGLRFPRQSKPRVTQVKCIKETAADGKIRDIIGRLT